MTRDLVVLVPDKDIEQSICGILNRPEAVGMRSLKEPQIVIHPQRDPGVYHTGYELIAPYARECRHALVCFDRAWDGAPSDDPVELAEHVLKECRRDWQERVEVVVIDPEVEAWVWSDSPHVATALGWENLGQLRAWLRGQYLWTSEDPKPRDPKAAFERSLHEKHLPPSSSVFRELADSVSFQRCADPAFGRLTDTLRTWFPVQGDPS